MRVLAIGDSHNPVCHPLYLEFCQDLAEQWNVDQIVHIGDMIDLHAISFHAKHPECPGPKDETELARVEIHKWYGAFPSMKLCIGNHDDRPKRLAETLGIPRGMLREYPEYWGTPGWDWQYDFIVDNVYYYHGVGQGGMYPAINAARKQLISTVSGHVHTAGGVVYDAGPTTRIFGLNTGCGIDQQAWQFAYCEHAKRRPILGAGIILDGTQAIFEIMPCGPGERYNRTRS